jgi:hypothetical protein
MLSSKNCAYSDRKTGIPFAEYAKRRRRFSRRLKPPIFKPDLGPRRNKREPDLCLMPSGIAAHCHPNLCGDWKREASRICAGVRMPDRTAKFVSAIFASVLAGASLTISHGAAHAADDCLSAPNSDAPQGSHWHYRIDHATKSQCWYLREEGEKLSQTVPPSSSRAAKPIAPKAETPLQRTVADAEAELAPQTRSEQPNLKNAAVKEDNGVTPGPAAAEPAANVQSNVEAAPPTEVAAVPLAAAESSRGRPATIPMLLGVMTGALALAGITASLVLRFGASRRPARRVRRDKIWESADRKRKRRSAHPPGADVLPRRPAFARDLDQAGEANDNDRVTEFFYECFLFAFVS